MASTRVTMTPLEPAIRQLEEAEPLDGVGGKVGEAVRDALPAGPVKDAVSGTWLGHAVHPMLTDVVLGSFMSVVALDLLGGPDSDTQARRLLGIGLAASIPTAVTGASDWADAELGDESVRRVGIVHAGLNTAALVCFGASLAARKKGARGRGAMLSLAGTAITVASGYLGGHLSLNHGIGPDQTIFDPGPEEWTPIPLKASEVHRHEASRVVAEDTPLLVTRSGGQLVAIHDRCSHRGCSLSDGEIEDGIVTCPCHGSRFHLADGAIDRGPATAPQPAFELREKEDDTLEVRRSQTGSAS